jgi:hypothetical protein
MRGGDALEKFRIFYGPVALVVDDYVEPLRPILPSISGADVVPGSCDVLAVLHLDVVDDGPLDGKSFGKAFGEDLFLGGIIMAAASGNEQSPDGFGGGCEDGLGESEESGGAEEKGEETAHHGCGRSE